MPDYKISASLMCADLANLEREIKKLEQAGVDWLHIDIMDGHFVPNFTFGPDIVKKVRAVSQLPLDIHLMVEEPERYIDIWQPTAKDMVSFHIETTRHPQGVIEQIKHFGSRPAIAFNPATPLSLAQYLLTEVDMVVIMTVNPGFAGQKWLPWVGDKLSKFSQHIKAVGSGLDIEVDGNIGEHNAGLLKKAGANVFVAGSASVFSTSDYLINAAKMREWLKN